MTVALILLTYAGLLAILGPRIVDRADWVAALPRLAIATWYALAASVVLAVSLAGLAVVMPFAAHALGPVGALAACVAALQELYGEIGGIAVAVVGTGLTWVVPLRLLAAWIAVARSAAAERARLCRGLASARRDARLGAVVVDAAAPAAYCIPGRGGLIVLSSGAVRLLERDRLEAVLAHERAHLEGRHHLIVAAAQAAHRAMGWLPLFACLPDRVGHLVELAADDAAARRTHRIALASSLLDFAAARAPMEALAAGGGHTVARIERLLHAPASPGRTRVGSVLGGNAAAVAAPVAVAGIPMVTAIGVACCMF